MLGTIGRGLSYEDLAPRCSDREISSGLEIRVLNLETLIEIKEAIASEKDQATLPILRRARGDPGLEQVNGPFARHTKVVVKTQWQCY